MANTNLTPIYQDYCIDMSSNNNFVQVPSVQGDGNFVRYVRIMLIANNSQYIVPEDVGVYIVGTKPDTKMIFNNCEVDENGRILVEITSQMTAVDGKGDYQVMLIDGESNSQLKTFPFYLITTKSYNAGEIISSNEYQALTEALAEMQADYEHYVTECAEYADEASSSAERAETAENNAKNSELTVKASEDAAKLSEDNAKISEQNAKASELTVKDSEDNAKLSEDNAKASELAAKASEDNAKVSEDNAKISEDNASASVLSAKASEDAAKASEDNAKISEDNAKASEDNAKTSEDNAKDSEDNAKASELAAAASASSIGEAETNCANSAQEAEDYANLARQWAVWQDGEQTPGTSNNARYWAYKAKEWSGFDDIDATSITYTKQDGSKVVLADYLEFLEELDGETVLVL